VALIDTALNLSRTPAPDGKRPAEQRARAGLAGG
jgi:hypothetical protein